MRRLNRYYNEAIVNNNKNKNLSSSDSQLGSISSAENTHAQKQQDGISDHSKVVEGTVRTK